MEFEIPWLQSKTVEIGYSGIILYSFDESVNEQLGYSINKRGESLIGFNEGDWLEGWYVIGPDILLGDPLFIDLNDPDIPVFTAAHGMGVWTPNIIAPSYTSFLSAVELLETISENRSNSIAIQSNPIPKILKQNYRTQIALLTGLKNNSFWMSFLKG